MSEEIECEQCKEKVRKINAKQRFCSPYCSDVYKREEKIRKWVEKKPRKIDPEAAAKMERSALYNKGGGWMKRFTACRG